MSVNINFTSNASLNWDQLNEQISAYILFNSHVVQK